MKQVQLRSTKKKIGHPVKRHPCFNSELYLTKRVEVVPGGGVLWGF